MRTFIVIWLGQLVSTLGNHMSGFALVVWAWEVTGSATALALVGFFYELPQIPIALFSGLLVDQFNRKHLMILGDAIAALFTITIGILYLTNSLQIWHIYLVASINGGFGQIQRLAYQTSVSLIVSPAQYTRANSMNSAVHYGSSIVAPAFAGFLYPLIQLPGILLVDLVTFAVAMTTILFAHIPQPKPAESSESITAQLTFGFRHIRRRPYLRALLLTSALFWFAHDLGNAVYDPMILARTNGNAQVLASTATAAGFGGVVGAIALSALSGSKQSGSKQSGSRQRFRGMLLGFMGAGLSKAIFGLGRSPLVWLPAQFCSSLNFPLISSSKQAILMEAIAPELQGKVFAADELLIRLVSAIAALIAGPLADFVLEPAMQSGSMFAQILGPAFGSQTGAGIAVLYVLCAIAMLLTGTAARGLMPKL